MNLVSVAFSWAMSGLGTTATGIPGDPMRLMFERDLTPSQYAAFYQWLQHGFQADAVVHFGMHGTVEWLRISLGQHGLFLVRYSPGKFAESIHMRLTIPQVDPAKQRGYGVLISHNVPPYDRCWVV